MLPSMTVDLTTEERNKLIGGPLAAAMAVMAVDMGIFSSAQEAIALGRQLAGAASRYASNPLIASLFDPEALKQGIRPEKLQVSPEDLRDGKLLDRALAEVDGAVALARTKGDEASAQQYCQLIVEGCEAVAAAAGDGLFGSGEKVSAAEKAALERIRQHLGVPPTTV
jgi:membrane-bound lytic murein transglycosylase B